jgi:hypothetical protein
MAHNVAMNHGVSSRDNDAVFLVKCADCQCLAVRGAGGRWKSFYNDAELPGNTEVIMAVPIELIRPFLPAIKRMQLCPASSSGQE